MTERSLTERLGTGASLDEWLDGIIGLHPVSWDLGLVRVAEVGKRLALLHPAPTTLLVAGTNGKGSVCEYLERFALANHLRVGKSTSPHLLRFNERIALDGSPASDELIVQAFEQIDQARGDTSLTYFEFAALASMLIFQQADVDVAILEIGLGGRLDAMNIVSPDLCIITSIGLDHQAHLGETREEIALEKAGIMRADTSCVVSDREPPASLLHHAAELNVPLHLIGRDFQADSSLQPQLPEDSLAAAMQGAKLLGWELSQAETIARDTRLGGRRTWVRGSISFLLDVAHNPAAAASLTDWLAALDWPGDIHAILGIYADKDVESISTLLAPVIASWHLTDMDEHRAETSSGLRQRLSVKSSVNVHTYDKIASALAGAEKIASEGDMILVFGSFPVVGGVLSQLNDANL